MAPDNTEETVIFNRPPAPLPPESIKYYDPPKPVPPIPIPEYIPIPEPTPETEDEIITRYRNYTKREAKEEFNYEKSIGVYFPAKAYAFIMSKIEGSKWLSDEEYNKLNKPTTLVEDLAALKKMLDDGSITQKQYDKAIAKILR